MRMVCLSVCVCVCVCVCVYLLGFVILNQLFIQGTLVSYLETTFEKLGYSLLLNWSWFSIVFQWTEIWNVFKIKYFMGSYWYCQFTFRTTNTFLNLINMTAAPILKILVTKETDMISHLFCPKGHMPQSQNYNINTTTINVFCKHVKTFFKSVLREYRTRDE